MTDEAWTIPGSPTNPIYMVEGETITWSVLWTDADSAVVSAISATKDESDYTSTCFPSGSTSQSGNIITWKPLLAVAGDGGESYVVASKCTVDGNTEIRKSLVHILSDETEK